MSTFYQTGDGLARSAIGELFAEVFFMLARASRA
jgi:hypothetical protein